MPRNQCSNEIAMNRECNIRREKQAPIRLFCEDLYSALDLRRMVDRECHRLKTKRHYSGFKCPQDKEGSCRIIGIINESSAGDVGCDLLQHLQHLADDRELKQSEARDIPAGPRKARHETLP